MLRAQPGDGQHEVLVAALLRILETTVHQAVEPGLLGEHKDTSQNEEDEEGVDPLEIMA